MSLSALPIVPGTAPSPEAPRADATRGGTRPEPGAFHAAVETAAREDASLGNAESAAQAGTDKATAADATPPDQPEQPTAAPSTLPRSDAATPAEGALPAVKPRATPEAAVKLAVPGGDAAAAALAEATPVAPLLSGAVKPVARQEAEPVRRKAASVPAAGDTTVPPPEAPATPPAPAIVVPPAVAQHAVKAGGLAFGEGAGAGGDSGGDGAGVPASAPGDGHVHGTVEAAPTTASTPASPADPRLPAAQFAQTLDAAPARPAALPYDARGDAAGNVASATVALRQGHFGTDIGVAIARALEPGPHGPRDALLVRLDPREMGRIDVRMAFDGDGTLRAVVSADSPAALDLLRRESTQLDRALSAAGVRADGQSLRFEGGGSSGAGEQNRPAAQPRALAAQGSPELFGDAPEAVPPSFRSLRGSGHLDVLA